MNTQLLKFIFILGIISLSLPLRAQHSLSVKVANIEEIKHAIEVCLYSTAEKYMSDAVSCEFLPVKSKNLSYTFDNLSNGTYAIVIFHDLNGNGDLDTNWMKIPKEPYGFSNNPSTTFGPPSFEETSFIVKGNTSVEVKLK
jgi:uncharacterized protein (DUF2141 family)